MSDTTYEHFLIEDWFGVSSFQDPRIKLYGASETEQIEFTSKLLNEQNQALEYARECEDRED